MTRRCSHCSADGHNARTCSARADPRGGGCVKLFGVRIADGPSIKKSASMGCLSHHSSSLSSAHASPTTPDHAAGYASDDPNHASCSSSCRGDRKKGTPWTEEEHRMFLVGLQKLGKGDWRGISRKYVVSRTPTQVASHAQKYFIRQTNATRRKRRSSLFDMVNDAPEDYAPLLEEPSSANALHAEPEAASNTPFFDLNIGQESPAMEAAQESPAMEAAKETPIVGMVEKTSFTDLSPVIPPFYPAFVPMPVPFWPLIATVPEEELEAREVHEVLRPTPILPKDPTHLDELVTMSRLSLREPLGDFMEPSALSSELHGVTSSTRRSAFHASRVMAGSSMGQNSGNAAIRAV